MIDRTHDLPVARREFSMELDKLRASLQVAEERYQAVEKRALFDGKWME